jgi:hypothetical protein
MRKTEDRCPPSPSPSAVPEKKKMKKEKKEKKVPRRAVNEISTSCCKARIANGSRTGAQSGP